MPPSRSPVNFFIFVAKLTKVCYHLDGGDKYIALEKILIAGCEKYGPQPEKAIAASKTPWCSLLATEWALSIQSGTDDLSRPCR